MRIGTAVDKLARFPKLPALHFRYCPLRGTVKQTIYKDSNRSSNALQAVKSDIDGLKSGRQVAVETA